MTQPFHFPNGQAANDAQDLLELCKQYPEDATGYLVRQDLEKWLAYIGNDDVAECAANARQIDVEDRQKLEEFLNRCHALTLPKPVPAAEAETKIEENITVPESTATTIETPPEKTVTSPSATTTEPLEVVTPSEEAAPPLETVTSPKQPAAKTPVKATPVASQEKKPSFFHVVAKFIVRILYRNKA